MTARRAEEFSQALERGTPEERELATAFHQGDQDAYRAIYDCYAARVNNICRRMLVNPDDACEAAQEAFLRVYQGLPRFNGRYYLSAWVTRVATNVCLDFLRSRSRKPQEPTPIETITDVLDEPDPGDNPEVIYIRNAEGRRVRKVLQDMPPLHRAAIVLRDFEGLSYDEIASVLDLTMVQVKALIHRARKGFKRSWSEAVVSALVPASLLNRLRGAETTGSGPLSQVGATAQQAACLCGGALQGAGSFLAERAAATAVALSLGAAAATGAVGASSPEPLTREPDAKTLTQGASEDVTTASSGGRGRSGPTVRSGGAASGPLPSPSPSPSPTSSPPTGTPPPSEPPTASGGAEAPKPKPSPSPDPSPVATSPVYGPVRPAVGFDRHGPVRERAFVSNEHRFDCDAYRFEQALSAPIQDGAQEYAGSLVLSGGSSMSVELKVLKDKHEVRYVGGGPLVRNKRSKGLLELDYTGSFSTSGPADKADLPERGQFTILLTLDCNGGAVVTERVTFSTD